MAMKIIGGQASGIALSTPKTMDVRPTGVRAKKALFDSLNSSLGFEGKVIVDLFAGTGGLGLEAASRGAEKVFLVESSSAHCRLAEDNIEKIKRAGVAAEVDVIRGDVFSSPSRLNFISGSIDIIFADPPYAKFPYFFKKIMNDANFADWAKNAVIIWENPPDFKIGCMENNPFWKLINIRKFAQTQFIFLTQKP